MYLLFSDTECDEILKLITMSVQARSDIAWTIREEKLACPEVLEHAIDKMHRAAWTHQRELQIP